jgi:hypothetical protein
MVQTDSSFSGQRQSTIGSSLYILAAKRLGLPNSQRSDDGQPAQIVVKFYEKGTKWEANGLRTRWAPYLGLGLLVTGGLALLMALLPGAARFDLVGMLRELTATNDQIARTNTKILASLEAIESRARGVDRMAEQLGSLEQQVAAERAQLARLEAIIAEQAALGRQLSALTGSIAPHTESLARTARAESDLVAQMNGQTGVLGVQLKRVRELNEALQTKLLEAERRSAAILAAMP